MSFMVSTRRRKLTVVGPSRRYRRSEERHQTAETGVSSVTQRSAQDTIRVVQGVDSQKGHVWVPPRSQSQLTINASSSSTLSPNLNAKSQTACVQLSTDIFSSYVNACDWLVTRAWSTIVRASAVRPDIAQPMCESISMIFSMDEDSSKGDGTRFSTARTTPSGVVMPTVVDPSCE